MFLDGSFLTGNSSAAHSQSEACRKRAGKRSVTAAARTLAPPPRKCSHNSKTPPRNTYTTTISGTHFTLFSEFFSSFVHTTCTLSVSRCVFSFERRLPLADIWAPLSRYPTHSIARPHLHNPHACSFWVKRGCHPLWLRCSKRNLTQRVKRSITVRSTLQRLCVF